ncbi:MAG: cobalt ECF transporter T component CbiQ [Deltaproteobacteria bacterium]|nr:cobalt ECF transporter T component CbiQ [Deltaproteobacteria bacterium]
MIVPGWLTGKRPSYERGKRLGAGVVEANLKAAAAFLRSVFGAHSFAVRLGLLQRVDARAKIAGLAAVTAAAGVVNEFEPLLAFLWLAVFLAWMSSLTLRAVARRVVVPALFTFIVALPVAFSFFTPGAELYSVAFYPQELVVTVDGALILSKLVLRVFVMASFVALLLLTTKEEELFEGFGALPLPALFTSALFMAFRYVFVVARFMEDFSMARKARVVSRKGFRGAAGWAGFGAALLFERSFATAEEVSMAMRARGFGGSLITPEPPKLAFKDYFFVFAAFFLFFISFTL